MEKIRIFQKGFNYSQDGQGNRLVYHLQGCNMKCPWCANPEGMKMGGALYLDKDWIQDELCPKGAVRVRRNIRFFFTIKTCRQVQKRFSNA